MWIFDVAMKTWIRGFVGVADGFPRPVDVLERRCATGPRCRPRHGLRDRFDRLEVALATRSGSPASMMSTPSRASCSAISSFSPTSSEMPGRLLAVSQGRVEDLDGFHRLHSGAWCRTGIGDGIRATKNPPAGRHGGWSASTSGRSRLRKEEAQQCVVRAQILVHESDQCDQSMCGKVKPSSSDTDGAWKDARMRKLFKRAAFAGVIAGLGYAIWRFLNTSGGSPAGGVKWETAPFPFPPEPRPSADPIHGPTRQPGSRSRRRGSSPMDGACPTSHPVKAKLSSGIFHVPGGSNYDRTHADRCYVDGDAAASRRIPAGAALTATRPSSRARRAGASRDRARGRTARPPARRAFARSRLTPRSRWRSP